MSDFIAYAALAISTAAIAVPVIRDRRGANNRAIGMAVAILPDLLFIEISLERGQGVVSMPMEELAGPSSVTSNAIRRAIIPPPTMLDRLGTELWRIGGDAGVSCSQLLAVLHQWNTLLSHVANRVDERGKEQLSANMRDLKYTLKALEIALADAKKGVEAIHP